MRLRSTPRGRAALCLAALLPPLLIAVLIYKYGVDLPYSDEWELAPILFKYAEGKLAFRHLFALQNEYRQFFPNLVIIFMGWATGWDVRYEIWVSFILAAITSFNIYRLGRVSFGGDEGHRTIAFLLSNLLIFSPAQSMNWVMGQQLIYFFPAACVTTCLVVTRTGLSFWRRFALCACLSTISTFSSANGVVCWLVVLPALLWTERGVERSRMIWASLAWAASFVANVTIYLNGYNTPASHPSLLTIVRHPLRGLIYFLSLLGSPLVGELYWMYLAATLVGLALLALYVAAGLRLLWLGARDVRRHDLIVWFALGAYSILSAGLVTFGRAGFGVMQALSSRYTTFMLYLAIAVIHLVALDRSARGEGDERSGRAWSATVAGGVATFVALSVLASIIAVRQMRVSRFYLLQLKACLLSINIMPDTCIGQRRDLFDDVVKIKEWATRLDEMGFMRPALFKDDRVSEFADEGAPAFGDQGTFDISKTVDGELKVAGTATLLRRGEPADGVIIAYEDGAGEAHAVALAELEGAKEIFGRMQQLNPRRHIRWQKTLSAGDLPPQAVALSAWALDAETGTAQRIGDARPIRRTE